MSKNKKPSPILNEETINNNSEIKMRHSILIRLILLTSIFIMVICCGRKKETYQKPGKTVQKNTIDSIWFEYENITGIGYEADVTRRDPSDIIKVNDTYFIWYTKIPAKTNGEKTPLYNSGYYGTIWYATSNNGISWEEKGQAIAPGIDGTFDSHAVFTPNILVFKGKYYLYYTGVKPTPGDTEKKFENNSESDITAIGLAVADAPDGPFSRISNQPILTISKDSSAFDSYRIDDAALNIRDEKIWLYYKGRSRIYGKQGPGHTQMGIAVANNPEGPYEKLKSPVLARSHEVLIWNQNGGIASLACLNKSLNFAANGIDFKTINKNLHALPAAPGLYRPAISSDSDNKKVNWGLSMAQRDKDIYLTKFKMYFE
ncbi:family 43 glycosylhydrolase [Maribellus maritimus]|uniref:family 43 glycosylhydrolase n=1 Tax=Maribellus maritimus TaxID=2870838 RepID=UPI001EEC7AC5|nr:family 43 glycosylhydrolase [Maribellus maritimus]MCG6190111.1 family 43 glycosylhydrolase [Maribellus maritimus]